MRIREHLLVDFLICADDFTELFREMSRSVLSLNHHKIVCLEVNFENKDETHLTLGRQNLNGILHQDVLLGFFTCGLLRVRTDSLNNDFHFKLIDRVHIGSVHQSEQDAELLARAYLPKG